MEPTCYQICVKGHLDDFRSIYFEGMAMKATFDERQMPVTIIQGALADQPALYGLLNRLNDQGITLISVTPCMKEELR